MDHIFKFPQSPKERIDFGIATAVCLIALSLVGWYAVKSADQPQLADTEIIEFNAAEIETETTRLTTVDDSDLEYQSKQPKSVFVKAPKGTPAVTSAKSRARYTAAAVPKRNATDVLGSFNISESELKTSQEDEQTDIVKIETDTKEEVQIDSAVKTETNSKNEASKFLTEIDAEIELLETKATENVDNTAATAKALTTTNKPNLSQVGTYKTGSCRILIGTFSDLNNHKNVIIKLQSEGYKTFKTSFQGLTRVGIYNDCDSASLESTLSMIRKDYAKDAMVLK